ncbi:MAG: lipid-A-disaccharide synthase, partial [Bacteroidota bacterium]
MKYYVIAGEASGDLHASNLIKELKKVDTEAEFRAWGGDQIEKQNIKVVKHYRELAFMGYVDVLMNIRTILRNMKFCKEDIEMYKPDALILVDYPGFNMRIATWAKKKGFKVFYYISPTVWAWKEHRVENIRKDTDRLFAILPFEKPFYAKHKIDVDYEGHPLLDAFENNKNSYGSKEEFISENKLDSRPIIAVLPGSRKGEIKYMLPEFVKVSRHFPEFQFIIAGAPSLEENLYYHYMPGKEMKILFGKTYQLLNFSHTGIITSGTATLETALFNVPQVVCYKGNPISFAIVKSLVMKNLKYISLVNLIMDQPILKELIQDEMNEVNIVKHLKSITNPGEQRFKILKGYQETREILGGCGASERIA